MYDPLVVDTFEKVQSALAEVRRDEAPVVLDVVQPLEPRAVPSPVPIENRSGSDSLAVLRLLEILSDLGEQPWEEAADLVAHRLALAVSYTHAALYVYDNAHDELVVSWVSPGLLAKPVHGLKIKRGEGVSGWVAANRRSISNSPSSLDLLAGGMTDVQFSGVTLSVPLTLGERLVGVFTLYRENDVSFSATELEILESASGSIGQMVSRSQPFAAAAARGDGQAYPTAHHLDAFLRQGSLRTSQRTLEKHLLVFQLPSDHESLELVNEMATKASSHLRGGDVVFVCDSRTIVCLLGSSSERHDLAVSQRISAHLERTIGVAVRSAIVVSPRDGANLASLLDAADRKLHKAVA